MWNVVECVVSFVLRLYVEAGVQLRDSHSIFIMNEKENVLRRSMKHVLHCRLLCAEYIRLLWDVAWHCPEHRLVMREMCIEREMQNDY